MQGRGEIILRPGAGRAWVPTSTVCPHLQFDLGQTLLFPEAWVPRQEVGLCEAEMQQGESERCPPQDADQYMGAIIRLSLRAEAESQSGRGLAGDRCGGGKRGIRLSAAFFARRATPATLPGISPGKGSRPGAVKAAFDWSLFSQGSKLTNPPLLIDTFFL